MEQFPAMAMLFKNFWHMMTDGKRVRVLLLLAGDSLCVGGVFWVVLWAYRAVGFGDYELRNYWGLLPFLLIFLFCSAMFRCYHGSIFSPGIGLNKIEEIRRLAFAALLTYLLVLAYLMLVRRGEYFSRFVLLVSMPLTVILLPLERFLVRLSMKHLHIGQIDVLIAGAGQTGEAVLAELLGSCYYGFHVVGFLDDDRHKQGQSIRGVPVLGPLNAAGRVARQRRIEYIICCVPIHLLEQTFRNYSKIFRCALFVPDNSVLPISWLYPASVGLYGGFEVRNQLLQFFPRLLKQIVEFLLAVTVSVFLLPLFLVLTLLVKLSSPGPVLYTAKRLGRGGKNIRVLKFRTMYTNADAKLEQMLEEDPEKKKEWEQDFKLRNDPRITPIGKFLRATSLDELPQFWNVLRGDMAVIGPRPIIEKEVARYGESYKLRLRVKPGITGLWQVSGRNETDYRHRVMLDMYYIMNWSLWMDYYIFFKTIFIVITRRGAR